MVVPEVDIVLARAKERGAQQQSQRYRGSLTMEPAMSPIDPTEVKVRPDLSIDGEEEREELIAKGLQRDPVTFLEGLPLRCPAVEDSEVDRIAVAEGLGVFDVDPDLTEDLAADHVSPPVVVPVVGLRKRIGVGSLGWHPSVGGEVQVVGIEQVDEGGGRCSLDVEEAGRHGREGRWIG